jgi:hypothetical protein
VNISAEFDSFHAPPPIRGNWLGFFHPAINSFLRFIGIPIDPLSQPVLASHLLASPAPEKPALDASQVVITSVRREKTLPQLRARVV